MYKFKDLGVYRDIQTGQLRLAVISHKDSHQEAFFVADGSVVPFRTVVSSMGCYTKYFNLQDSNRWGERYQRNSVMERLLGISFDDNQEFSLEDLQALDLALNVALSRSFSSPLEVAENGTGDFEYMKKGDILLEPHYQDFRMGYLFTERNGKYSVVSRAPRSIISQTGVKTTIDDFPRLKTISFIKGQSEFGVFPDRSKYLDAAECPWFTLEAYEKFSMVQKEPETDDSNDKK